jgi:hypothetical protein
LEGLLKTARIYVRSKSASNNTPSGKLLTHIDGALAGEAPTV